jgi:hypothetical protein
MKHHNDRPIASNVRKSLPSLRRVVTPTGRMWTVDGERLFKTLREVVLVYLTPAPAPAPRLPEEPPACSPEA